MLISNFLSTYGSSSRVRRYTVLMGTFFAGVAGLLSIAWIGSIAGARPSNAAEAVETTLFDLNYFAGSWTISGSIQKEPQGPSSKITGTAEIFPGGDDFILQETVHLEFDDATKTQSTSSIKLLPDEATIVLSTTSARGGTFETVSPAPVGTKELVFAERQSTPSMPGHTRMVVKILDATTYISSVLYRTASGDEKLAGALTYSRKE